MSSLPQLNVLTYNNQITWLFFTFIILYFFISRSFFPKILNLFNEREKYIESMKNEISNLFYRIQQIKINNTNLIENSKYQVGEIIKNIHDQKSIIKKKFDDDSVHFIKLLNDEFKSDIKNNFEFNKTNIYNEYLQINSIFLKNFLDNQGVSENDLKYNFDKYYLAKKNQFVK